MHKEHKILELSDEKSFEKENITIESSTKDFNESNQKIIDLKNKIENEINKVNNLYEKVIDELTKSFIKKHEELLKQENNIKDKLKNEVNKTKEKLENFWRRINNEIKLNEKISKGIKNFKKEEKNMWKILSYISKINKNQKEINRLLSEKMENIKFNYQEEKSDINYEEYYFNGINNPKDIEFKDITCSSLNISWKMDNNNNINIDNNKIKYKVEMKKVKEEVFNKVYEGSDLNCKINNLEAGFEYEFRFCSFYNDIMGPWSEIKKIKTKDIIDSNILKDLEKKNEYIKKMIEWSGYKNMELIYRGSRDGMTANKFHEKCNNKGPTICLYKNEKSIFGGYTSISWTGNGGYKNSKGSFIFTLKNIHNTEPTKFPLKNPNDNHSIYDHSSYGPTFGAGRDIGLNYSDFQNNDSYSNFPYTYNDTLGKGHSIFSGDVSNSNKRYRLKELEVFKLSK